MELLKTNPQLKDNLWKNANMLKDGLRELGLNLGDSNSCVTPVYLDGTSEIAAALVYDLRENHNVFCSIVVYPVIPKGLIMLRLIVTSNHTNEDIIKTIEAIQDVNNKLSEGLYKANKLNVSINIPQKEISSSV